MYIGKLKACYVGKKKVFNEAPIVVKCPSTCCINQRGEDFSHLYDWYKLDFNSLEIFVNE